MCPNNTFVFPPRLPILAKCLVTLLFLTSVRPVAAQWSFRLDKDISASAAIRTLTSDASGNLYVAGAFESTVLAGTDVIASAGLSDMFIAKYDTAGNLLWMRRFGGPLEDRINGIAADSAGNVYITGHTEGGYVFGQYFVSQQGLFVAQVSAEGYPFWIQSVNFTPGLYSTGYGIATDKNGFVLVTGYSRPEGSDAPQHMITARYSTTGLLSWYRVSDDASGVMAGYDICVDPLQRIGVVGSYNGGSASLVLRDTLQPKGGEDVIFMQHKFAGYLNESKLFGGPGEDRAQGIAADTANRFYIAGYFSQRADFDTFTVNSNGGKDVFLTCISRAGEIDWVLAAGGLGDDEGIDVVSDINQNTYLTGIFEDSIRLGEFVLRTSAGKETFLAKVSKEGEVLWAINSGWLVSENEGAIPAQLPGLSGMVDLVVNADYSVLLSSFEGAWQADTREVRLNWISHIEIDSDHFEVESSTDGSTWTNAGFVNAAGISLDSLSYRFTDSNSPLRSSGKAFYRLRIVDTEGSSAYSSVLQINRAFEPDLHIYPNPFRDKVNIGLPGLSEPTTLYLRVMDAMGRVLYESEHEALGEVLVLEPASWIRGLYFVQLRSADGKINLCHEVVKLP